MPPFTIDPTELWEAIRRLADDRDQSWRFTKKGDKRPAYDVEAQKAAMRATLAAKRKAAGARIEAERRAKLAAQRPKPGEDIASRMLRAMEPQKFYGAGDLARMIGADRSARGKVHQVLMQRKAIERVRNPAWSDSKLNPWEIMAGAEPHPQHLYTLTEAGLKARDALGASVPSGRAPKSVP